METTTQEAGAQIAEDEKTLRVALAASPTRGAWHYAPHFGEWQIGSDYSVDGEARGTGRQLVAYSPRANKRATPAYAAMFEANGRFIAAASPDRITRVLDELQRLRAENMRLSCDAGRLAAEAELHHHDVTRERAARQAAQRELEQARIDRNNARLDVMRETHEQMKALRRERDEAAATEREACAVVAESEPRVWDAGAPDPQQRIAAAIRTRGAA